MNGFLLDTNVVSELTRTEPNSNVIAFLSEHQDLWLSAIVVHELEFGLQLLPDGQRRDLLSAALSGICHRIPGPCPSCRQGSGRVGRCLSIAGASRRTGWIWGCAYRRNRPGP